MVMSKQMVTLKYTIKGSIKVPLSVYEESIDEFNELDEEGKKEAIIECENENSNEAIFDDVQNATVDVTVVLPS